jgi:multiple sugar transport system ATP-binding protein
MAEIILKDVIKRFGNVTAVDCVNLTARDKEFLVLVGPSGCGKTTTLRMVAGLEGATHGEIYIGSRKVNHVPPKDRDIAMVFQNYALYPNMDVYRNMAFGLQLRKFPKEETKSRVNDGARILSIEDLLERRPRELSGGQRQRVAMGRAIVRKPKAFLFDEPLSNLDAKLRVQMRGELAKLHERLETTIMYVTHDQTEAMTLADRIVVMNKGRILQIGSPLEVYNHPANLFVAGFIGSPAMNLLETTIEEENRLLFVKGENFKLRIPETLWNRYLKVKGLRAIFGIRPEHLCDKQIKTAFPGGEVLKVMIDVVEPLGSGITVLASCGPAQITASLDPQTNVNLHTEMELLVDMNRMHLFDAATNEVY